MAKSVGFYRWPFRHKLRNGKVRTYWFKVILASDYAYPILHPEHVRESIERNGVGDTQNCSEAVCAQRNPKAFKHSVEGTVDFTYRRAAVVNKIYAEPRRLRRSSNLFVMGECVLYGHHHANIAKLNDSLNGQRKLLEILLKDGPLQQTFLPLTKRTRKRNAGVRSPKRSRRSGERTRFFQRGKARAAFAVAALELEKNGR